MNTITDEFRIHSYLDQEDALDQNAAAALAILDCVRVLCALARTPIVHDAERATGQGFASGECVTDDTLPTAIHHAMGLVRTMHLIGNEAFVELRKR